MANSKFRASLSKRASLKKKFATQKKNKPLETDLPDGENYIAKLKVIDTEQDNYPKLLMILVVTSGEHEGLQAVKSHYLKPNQKISEDALLDMMIADLYRCGIDVNDYADLADAVDALKADPPVLDFNVKTNDKGYRNVWINGVCEDESYDPGDEEPPFDDSDNPGDDSDYDPEDSDEESGDDSDYDSDATADDTTEESSDDSEIDESYVGYYYFASLPRRKEPVKVYLESIKDDKLIVLDENDKKFQIPHDALGEYVEA